MKLIFVRHGEPDYVKDSLTEKGFREAEIVAARITKLDVRDFYCSPLGRAKDTAAPTLKRLNRTAETLDWLREFPAHIIDPETGRERNIIWDMNPSYWTRQDEFYDKDAWLSVPAMQTGPVKECYEAICTGLDKLLLRYGYCREGRMYRTDNGNSDTIVIFCHLGLQCMVMSYLLGISPIVLLHGFYMPPTGVTTISTEEIKPGEVHFRVKGVGDISHLYFAGEVPSESGFLGENK